jgi:hypothetical protein
VQAIKYLLWEAITRLKSAKYLRWAYVDVDNENILVTVDDGSTL